jgi:hypothetical protein
VANFRYVNTMIWDDEWFTDLDALEQHLFIYLLTNSYTNLAGVYQISMKKIAFETGMDQEKVKKILARFAADGKVFYEVGWVIMKNWQKHQKLNPNQFTAVQNSVNAFPQWLKLLIFDPNSPMYLNFEALTNGSLRLEKGSLSLGHNIIKYNKTKVNINKTPLPPKGKATADAEGESESQGGGEMSFEELDREF